VWADLGSGVPEGICIDAHGAVWYADVPNYCCMRVREGGYLLQTVNADGSRSQHSLSCSSAVLQDKRHRI
jgi:sugar lactone lactonase YvrE